MKKFLSFLLLLIFTTECALGAAAEVNFWKSRQKNNPSHFLSNTISETRPLRKTAPRSTSSKLNQVLANLSLKHGSIQDVHVSHDKNSRPVLIHIQDIHLNQEAQKNIARAIKKLIDKNQVDLVALEGAFNDIDLDIFRRFPNPKTTKKVADHLLVSNQISGPIHALLTSRQKTPAFVGIDHVEHYLSHVAAVKKANSLRTEGTKFVRGQLRHQKVRTFNKDLSLFDEQVNNYRKKSTSIGSYVDFLLLHEKNPSKMISQFHKALRLEKNLNYKQVERERSWLISRLMKNLPKTELTELLNLSVAFRTKQMTAMAFYEALKDLSDKANITMKTYPSMNNYIRYIDLSDSINARQLTNEIKELENKIYGQLAKTKLEKKLINEDRYLYLVEKLADFSLTSDEWIEYKNHSSHQHIFKPKTDLTPFEAFYEEAENRDHAMAQNLASQIKAKNSQVVVLVTGGFHTQGIKKIIKDIGLNIVTYVPKITSIKTSEGTSYLSVFTQRKKPLEEIFKGKKLFLTPSPTANSTYVKAAFVGVESWLSGKLDFAVNYFSSNKSLRRKERGRTESRLELDINNATIKYKFDLGTNKQDKEDDELLRVDVEPKVIHDQKQVAKKGAMEEFKYGLALIGGVGGSLGLVGQFLFGMPVEIGFIFGTVLSLTTIMADHWNWMYVWEKGTLTLRGPPTKDNPNRHPVTFWNRLSLFIFIGIIPHFSYTALVIYLFQSIHYWSLLAALPVAILLHGSHNPFLAKWLGLSVGNKFKGGSNIGPLLWAGDLKPEQNQTISPDENQSLKVNFSISFDQPFPETETLLSNLKGFVQFRSVNRNDSTWSDWTSNETDIPLNQSSLRVSKENEDGKYTVEADFPIPFDIETIQFNIRIEMPDGQSIWITNPSADGDWKRNNFTFSLQQNEKSLSEPIDRFVPSFPLLPADERNYIEPFFKDKNYQPISPGFITQTVTALETKNKVISQWLRKLADQGRVRGALYSLNDDPALLRKTFGSRYSTVLGKLSATLLIHPNILSDRSRVVPTLIFQTAEAYYLYEKGKTLQEARKEAIDLVTEILGEQSFFVEKEISWLLTTKCGAKCTFCYGSPLVDGHPEKELDIDDVSGFLDFLWDKGVRNINVTGGEPLLHPNFHNIVKAIYDRGFKIRLNTTGQFPQKVKDVLPYLDQLSISMHSLKEEEHAAIKYLGVEEIKNILKEIYQATLQENEKRKIAQKPGIDFRIGTVFNALNKDSIEPLALYIKNEFPLARWVFYRVMIRDRAIDYEEELAVSKHDFEELKQLVRKLDWETQPLLVDEDAFDDVYLELRPDGLLDTVREEDYFVVGLVSKTTSRETYERMWQRYEHVSGTGHTTDMVQRSSYKDHSGVQTNLILDPFSKEEQHFVATLDHDNLPEMQQARESFESQSEEFYKTAKKRFKRTRRDYGHPTKITLNKWKSSQRKISVLIPHLPSRVPELMNRLNEVSNSALKDDIEIIINFALLPDPQTELLPILSRVKSLGIPTKIIFTRDNTIPIVRNLLLDQARGEYILQLDDDAQLWGDPIAETVKVLEDQKEIGIVGVPTIHNNQRFEKPKPQHPMVPHPAYERVINQKKGRFGKKLYLTTGVYGDYFMSRASILKALPFSNEWPSNAEDMDMSLRMMMMGYFPAYLEQKSFITSENISGDSVTADSNRDNRYADVLYSHALFLYLYADRFGSNSYFVRFLQFYQVAILGALGEENLKDDFYEFWNSFVHAVKKIMASDKKTDWTHPIAKYFNPNNKWVKRVEAHLTRSILMLVLNKKKIKKFKEKEHNPLLTSSLPVFTGPFSISFSENSPDNNLIQLGLKFDTSGVWGKWFGRSLRETLKIGWKWEGYLTLSLAGIIYLVLNVIGVELLSSVGKIETLIPSVWFLVGAFVSLNPYAIIHVLSRIQVSNQGNLETKGVLSWNDSISSVRDSIFVYFQSIFSGSLYFAPFMITIAYQPTLSLVWFINLLALSVLWAFAAHKARNELIAQKLDKALFGAPEPLGLQSIYTKNKQEAEDLADANKLQNIFVLRKALIDDQKPFPELLRELYNFGFFDHSVVFLSENHEKNIKENLKDLEKLAGERGFVFVVAQTESLFREMMNLRTPYQKIIPINGADQKMRILKDGKIHTDTASRLDTFLLSGASPWVQDVYRKISKANVVISKSFGIKSWRGTLKKLKRKDSPLKFSKKVYILENILSLLSSIYHSKLRSKSWRQKILAFLRAA